MNHKVLVVEDSRAYRNYLTQQLTTIGCDVVGCESYAETQKALDEHHNFHFAVLDYCLPDAQDGDCLLYTSPSPRDPKISRMPSSA